MLLIAIIQIILVITIADYSDNTIICLTLGLAGNYCSFSYGNETKRHVNMCVGGWKVEQSWRNRIWIQITHAYAHTHTYTQSSSLAFVCWLLEMVWRLFPVRPCVSGLLVVCCCKALAGSLHRWSTLYSPPLIHCRPSTVYYLPKTGHTCLPLT